MRTNRFSQYRHDRTAVSSSSTIQLRPASGIQRVSGTIGPELFISGRLDVVSLPVICCGVRDEGARKAFRVQPVHVRDMCVESRNEVIEQRPMKLSVSVNQAEV